jgi:4-azaleucine resistance transporter AzlC
MLIKFSEIKSGIKAGIPIGIGYVPIAITFGLLSKGNGIPNYITILLSFLLYAGASQFIGVKMIGIGASPFEIIFTTFILNLRHFLMASTISQRIEKGGSKRFMAILAFGITDESFAVATMGKKGEINASFLLGLNVFAYSSWNLGTWIGLFLAAGLPKLLVNSMGIALYVMFTGLLVPNIRKSKSILGVVMISIATNGLLSMLSFQSSWAIIISTIVGAGAGTLLFKENTGGEQKYE